MIAEITLSNLKGSAMPPVSKSALHRNLICAALGRGEKIIEYRGALFEDGAATMRCLETLGAAISEEDGSYRVKPIDFSEKKSKENGGCSGDDKVPVLECGESGSTLRMLLPVAAAMKMKCKFILEGRLPERPLSPLWEELCRHGAKN